MAAATKEKDPVSTLVEDATPTTVDADALLKQMAELQARLTAMEAERGIPADAVEAKMQALRAHYEARKVANPGVDFSEIHEVLENLPVKSDGVTREHTELVRDTVQDYVRRSPVTHELAYLSDLAGELHKEVLKRDTKK